MGRVYRSELVARSALEARQKFILPCEPMIMLDKVRYGIERLNPNLVPVILAPTHGSHIF